MLTTEPDNLEAFIKEIQAAALNQKDSMVLIQVELVRGIQFARANAFDSAVHIFQNAWEFGYRRSDTLMMVMALNNIAGVHNYLGNYERSLEYNQKAIDLLGTPKDAVSKAKLLLSRGKIQNINDQSEEAMFSLKAAADIFQATGSEDLWLNTMREMGVTYAKQDKHMDALSLYYAVLPLMRDKAFDQELVELKQRMAESYIHLGQFERALPLLKESLESIDSLNIGFSKEPILKMLIEASAEAGNVDDAMMYSRMLVDWTKEMEESNVKATVEKLELQYQARQKDLQNTVLQAEARQRELQLENARYLLMGLFALLVLLSVGMAVIYFYSRKVKALNRELEEVNAGLEEVIEEKTAKLELRTQRIMETSFSLAHDIRSSVVTVLGAVQLMQTEADLSSADQVLVEAVYVSSNKLDTSVQSLITRLDNSLKE